jgi:hypothetical protein
LCDFEDVFANGHDDDGVVVLIGLLYLMECVGYLLNGGGRGVDDIDGFLYSDASFFYEVFGDSCSYFVFFYVVEDEVHGGCFVVWEFEEVEELFDSVGEGQEWDLFFGGGLGRVGGRMYAFLGEE